MTEHSLVNRFRKSYLSRKKVLTILLLKKKAYCTLILHLDFLNSQYIERYFIIFISDTVLPNLFKSTFTRANVLFQYINIDSSQDGFPNSYFHQQFMRMPVSYKIATTRASLVAKWLRIWLPVQETRGRALVREDPTCRGATKPLCHNY